MSVFGTRPEAIKMAPLVKALEACDAIESRVCLTGQHREMLDSVMQIFHLHGDFDLDIMEQRQTLSTITCKTLPRHGRVFEQDKPDLILVHGDTSTTFAGALAAFYHQVKVGHVEAGLRTWDKYSPFPEEMNRTLVGDIADLHFSPTKANAENLRRESIMGDIFITGNTAIDAMRYTVRPDYKFSTAILNELDFAHHRVLAVTCHRRENYGRRCRTSCTPSCAWSRKTRMSRSSIRCISARSCANVRSRSWAAIRASTSSTRSTSRRCTT